jgi:hypothetical protein
MALAGFVKGGSLAELSPGALKLLLILYAHADSDGEAWPSRETIARQAAMAARSVSRARQELIDRGLMTSLDGGTGRDALRVRLHLDAAGEGGREETPVSPQGGHQCHPRGDTSVTQNSPIEQSHRTTPTTPPVRAGEGGARAEPDPPARCNAGRLQPADATTTRPGSGVAPGVAADHAGAFAGLFDLHEGVDTLCDLDAFDRHDAARLVRKHGLPRVRAVAAHVAAEHKAGRVRTTPKRLAVHLLTSGADVPAPEGLRRALMPSAGVAEGPSFRGRDVDGDLCELIVAAADPRRVEAARRRALAAMHPGRRNLVADKPAISPGVVIDVAETLMTMAAEPAGEITYG